MLKHLPFTYLPTYLQTKLNRTSPCLEAVKLDDIDQAALASAAAESKDAAMAQIAMDVKKAMAAAVGVTLQKRCPTLHSW